MKARQKYRAMCGKLDSVGFAIYISRVDKKCYNFIVNGEVKKVYKQRKSCNRQIEKLYKNFNQNE
jgi:hypothetical protein